ncbi:hypothetical protein O6H91_Y545500 [Diphasiastrum complanatum]|nr:hypothetical protein O6H91_Y545500 [Diphasiastrum complanatum]
MDDLTRCCRWKFRFRFWPNNKSRMYVLEYTGEFVKHHQLQKGDKMVIYEDQISRNYVIHGQKARYLDNPIEDPICPLSNVIKDDDKENVEEDTKKMEEEKKLKMDIDESSSFNNLSHDIIFEGSMNSFNDDALSCLEAFILFDNEYAIEDVFQYLVEDYSQT